MVGVFVVVGVVVVVVVVVVFVLSKKCQRNKEKMFGKFFRYC